MPLFRFSAEIKVGPADQSLFFPKYEYRNIFRNTTAADAYTAELKVKEELADSYAQYGQKIYGYKKVKVVEVEKKSFHPRNKPRNSKSKHNNSGRDRRVSF
jgi:hypothetical protein